MLWRLLYETAARSAEVLGLDVEDVDLPNHRARVRRPAAAGRSPAPWRPSRGTPGRPVADPAGRRAQLGDGGCQPSRIGPAGLVDQAGDGQVGLRRLAAVDQTPRRPSQPPTIAGVLPPRRRGGGY